MEALLENPENQVIAVVGMGGLGKTFLLQYVFNALKSRYHHFVWLSISKSYSVKSLQRDIASHIGVIVGADVSEERAAVLIHDCLQGKRYLIVLNDLWRLSREDNLLDKLGLPGDKDCKILVSSRNREVATNLISQIYEMNYLSDKESWELFCFYAFPDRKENRAPAHLKEVGHGIVKQCGNLPLAIKTTAASLGNTTSVSTWESKHDKLKKAVIPFGENDPVMDILRLTYDSLPAHLKAFFAYLSFFPEDASIDCEDLVYLWIGEGLIPAGAREEQCDMAWNWVDQLAQLCLLQLWENLDDNVDNEIRKYCAIHDLLHDLSINISRENKSVFSVEEAAIHTNGSTRWCRILLGKKDIDDNALSGSLGLPVYVRTLSLSQNMEITNIPQNLFTAMRGLRVLDLSGTGIRTLPESVGKMILLKVLNLRDTWIREVPGCVRYLKSLLFLAMPYRCSLLPVWITGLRCLQHLECGGVSSMPRGTSRLVSLRTLRTYSYVYLESLEEDMVCMTQLEEISLSVNSEREVKRIEEGLLVHLLKMRRLRIDSQRLQSRFWRYGGCKNIHELSDKIRVVKHLERLTLRNFVVPSWMCDLANLRELELNHCHSIDYPGLEEMPNLGPVWVLEYYILDMVNSGRSCIFKKMLILKMKTGIWSDSFGSTGR